MHFWIHSGLRQAGDQDDVFGESCEMPLRESNAFRGRRAFKVQAFPQTLTALKREGCVLKWPWREVLNNSRRVTYSGRWEIEAIMSRRALPEAI